MWYLPAAVFEIVGPGCRLEWPTASAYRLLQKSVVLLSLWPILRSWATSWLVVVKILSTDYSWMLICTSVPVYAYVYLDIHIYICIYVYIHPCIQTHICMRVCVYIYTVYTCIWSPPTTRRPLQNTVKTSAKPAFGCLIGTPSRPRQGFRVQVCEF